MSYCRTFKKEKGYELSTKLVMGWGVVITIIGLVATVVIVLKVLKLIEIDE